MKKVLTAIFCCFCFIVQGQWYELHTQAEVDNFQNPQMGIIDHLKVSGPDITNLNGLIGITTVGNIEISETNISNLIGLNNLKLVDVIYIHDNPLLFNINVFDSLKYVSSVIQIENNPLLSSISTFNQINSIIFLAEIIIRNNTNLTEISGFNALEYVGDYAPPFGSLGLISIDSNTALESITGFQKLKLIGLFLTISANPTLKTISGFDSLSLIGTEFQMIDDSSLVDMTGFNNLDSVGEGLQIINTRLTNFEPGFKDLTYVGDKFFIQQNRNMQTLQGLNALQEVGGTVAIWDNPKLAKLDGMKNLQSAKGISIAYNALGDSLIDDFDALKKVGSFGITMMNNDSLKYLTCFNALDTIQGSLTLTDNSNLGNIQGFQSLKFIGKHLAIGGSNFLPAFSPIESIGAFDHPILIAGDLTIRKTLLSDCSVISVCQYLSNPNGLTTIQLNQTGCNSPAQVIESCAVGLYPIIAETGPAFRIIPNPASSNFSILIDEETPEGTTFNIYSLIGEPIITVPLGPRTDNMVRLDSADLESGLYFCMLKAPDKGITGTRLLMIQK